MKFGLMYEIQIPEPHYPGVEQERYKASFGPGGPGGRGWVRLLLDGGTPFSTGVFPTAPRPRCSTGQSPNAPSGSA